MFSLPVFQPLPSTEGEPQTVEVTFKGSRRGYYVSADESLRVRDYVVVEAERGEDLGRITSLGAPAAKKCAGCSPGAETPSQAVVRRAEPEEVQRLMVLRADEERVRRKAREMVDAHHLTMKVTETEWQWDRNKLTLYFTAERRVDFRELVRDLARTFRTRIELKQIGVRDEAALLGGVGRCGRELCCSTGRRGRRPGRRLSAGWGRAASASASGAGGGAASRSRVAAGCTIVSSLSWARSTTRRWRDSSCSVTRSRQMSMLTTFSLPTVVRSVLPSRGKRLRACR